MALRRSRAEPIHRGAPSRSARSLVRRSVWRNDGTSVLCSLTRRGARGTSRSGAGCAGGSGGGNEGRSGVISGCSIGTRPSSPCQSAAGDDCRFLWTCATSWPGRPFCGRVRFRRLRSTLSSSGIKMNSARTISCSNDIGTRFPGSTPGDVPSGFSHPTLSVLRVHRRAPTGSPPFGSAMASRIDESA